MALRHFKGLSCELSLVGLSQLIEVYSLLRTCFIVQKATIDRTGVETMSSMSNGRRVSRNSLDTRNMAQFISLDPKSDINNDAAAEEVLAKVCADAAKQPLSQVMCALYMLERSFTATPCIMSK